MKREKRMLKKLCLFILNNGERQIGESVEWARYVLKTSTVVIFKYFLFIPLATHRKNANPSVISIARLISVKEEGCGSCVQIEINQAKKFHVALDIISHTINEEYSALPPELELVARFTDAVLRKNGQEVEFRHRVVQEYGENVHVEISLAIASSKFYPIAKRALGYSNACKLEGYKV